jgi:hypothetical protein
MGSWLNPDGLYLKFGTSGTTGIPNEGVSLQNIGHHQADFSGESFIEIPLSLTVLTETESIQSDVAVIPDNSLITAIEIVTVTAAATGVAIDLGTIHISRNASDSEFTADPDGLLAAFITASMDTPGQTVRFFASGTADTEESLPSGVTTGGVQIGDITTAPLLITASRTTSTAFTAGRVIVRVWYVQNPTGGFVV